MVELYPKIQKVDYEILVIGSGGREHALCWAISNSRWPGLLCPGRGRLLRLQKYSLPVHEIEALHNSQSRIELTIVGPELPLTLGIVDLFEQNGLAIIGPNAAAARLEGSRSLRRSSCSAMVSQLAPSRKPAPGSMQWKSFVTDVSVFQS